MLDSFFTGLFTQTESTFSIGGFLICLCSALALGLLISFVHMKTQRTSAGFAVTLAVIPAIVCVIIMMVSGSLGAGIAVAGAFSLVRFRSVPGTAREIGAVFLAMATGLSCGMGYPAFGLVFAVILCAVLIIYSKVKFGERKAGDLTRTLNITVPEDINYTDIFTDLFEKYTSYNRLVKVKTTNLGSLNKLKYAITLKNPGTEKLFIDELRCRNGNLEIAISDARENNQEL